MGKKILVADDERDTANFLKSILERKGCEVSVVYDGLQAKSLLEANNYDAVLLDCSMPELTGPELVGSIRRKSPKTKIIIFSGLSAVDNKLAEDIGADKFFQKPLTKEMIEEALGVE